MSFIVAPILFLENFAKRFGNVGYHNIRNVSHIVQKNLKKREIPAMTLATLLATSLLSTPIPVKIVKGPNGWLLTRGGKPYYIKGVGGTTRAKELKDFGGNTMRTWGSERAGEELDQMHQHGLTLMLGIWLGHKSYFDYKNPKQVGEQFERAKADVLKHRNHPALLIWGIGNEMEIDNDIPETWKAINDIAKMIKKLDPNHPTSTVVAEVSEEKIRNISKYCPDIDVLGINSYGGLPTLPQRLKKFGWTKPYIVTEFGPNGPWERPKTEWKAALEPTSTEKATKYASDYKNSIAGQPNWCLGSFAFLWGNKQEETPTWFGMFLPTGERTQAIEEISFGWTNQYPANRAPRIQSVSTDLAGKTIRPGSEIMVRVNAIDPNGDSLRYRWEIRSEAVDKRFAGENEKTPGVVPGPWQSVKSSALKLNFARETGNFRLYVFVTDGKGNAATANFPFQVK